MYRPAVSVSPRVGSCRIWNTSKPRSLARRVRDRAGQGADRHLLAGVPAARARALEQRIVRRRPAGHDVGEDVILAHRRVGGEVEPQTVEPSPRVHVDEHALVVAAALGRHLVRGVDVELGRVDRAGEVDVAVGQPELLPLSSRVPRFGTGSTWPKNCISWPGSCVTRSVAHQLDVGLGRAGPPDPDPPRHLHRQVELDAVHQARRFLAAG